MPDAELAKEALAVPIALTLISLGWWQNFVHTHSVFPFIRSLARLAGQLQVHTVTTEKLSITFLSAELENFPTELATSL